MTIQEFKEQLESENNIKISIKISSLRSSMRGYITFSIRGRNNTWDFDYRNNLAQMFKMNMENPTFVSSHQLDVYLGNEIYGISKNQLYKLKMTIK